MKTSQNGINLIKQFEGCRLSAYKPVAAEKYYTIGYGHYGADVSSGMKITQDQAENYLRADLAKYESAVNSTGLKLNQNQFDALVSFTYNYGAGNLKKLIANRNLSQIADALLLYNKGSGKVLPGLTKRRKAERELFLKSNDNSNYYPVYDGLSGSIVDALKSIGEKDITFAHRKKIAKANDIERYIGSEEPNKQLVELLKEGKLKRIN